MAELDLDIDNYTTHDLERFFRLDDNKKYDASTIEKNEYTIREQLLSSGHINKKFKRDLIEFLTIAKARLMAAKCPVEPEELPSTIPKNYMLDTDQVPRSKEEPRSREGQIIIRPETQFIHALPSDYFPGALNPLKTRVLKKHLTVDTRFRNGLHNVPSSDFSLTISQKLSKVVSMKLTALELPKTFYTISSKYGNNSFDMMVVTRIRGSLTGSSRTIVVPDGNYTSQSLVNILNDIVSPKNLDGTLIYPDEPFSYILFSLEQDNGKIFLCGNPQYLSDVIIVEIRMTFSNDSVGNDVSKYLTTRIGWNLGFLNCSYAGKTFYYGEKAMDPNGIKYIYLAVDDYNKNVNDLFLTSFEENTLSPDILARITLENEGTIINKNCQILTEQRKYFGPVDIQRLHVRLFDDHGRVLDMNHTEYSFCLQFEIMYDL